jgi:mRNA interferase HigB
VNVIAPRIVREFIEHHPDSEVVMREWYTALRRNDFPHFAALRAAFVVDAARNTQGDTVFIFDVAGNKYRALCFINFENQTSYIKYIFTHLEYKRTLATWEALSTELHEPQTEAEYLALLEFTRRLSNEHSIEHEPIKTLFWRTCEYLRRWESVNDPWANAPASARG